MKITEIRKITWEVRDRTGRLLSFETQHPNSYVQHLVNTLYIQFAQVNLATQKDTSDANQTMSINQNPNMSVIAANLDGNFGLVVGTGGATAVAIDQTKLVTKIAHGNTSGLLSHGTTTVTAPSTVSTTRSFTIQRTFTNNSGGTVTVSEIGIYLKIGTYIFMIERAISTKAITNGTSGTLTYTIGTTV